jgi:hypothetical protein
MMSRSLGVVLSSYRYSENDTSTVGRGLTGRIQPPKPLPATSRPARQRAVQRLVRVGQANDAFDVSHLSPDPVRDFGQLPRLAAPRVAESILTISEGAVQIMTQSGGWHKQFEGKAGQGFRGWGPQRGRRRRARGRQPISRFPSSHAPIASCAYPPPVPCLARPAERDTSC